MAKMAKLATAKGSGRKKIAITLVVVLVLGTVGYFLTKDILFKEVSAQNYTEYTVTRGNVSVALSGSGSIQPNAQYEVVSMVGGDVLEDHFLEGDHVEKGDLLYVFDSSDVEDTMDRANLSLEKSRTSYERTQDSYSALTVTAPEDGRIAEIYVSAGENVGNGGKVAKIIDDGTFKVRIPFSTGDISSLFAGQSVDVVIENTFETLPGTISKIYGSNRIIDGYIDVTDVEVEVKNPGALSSGIYVSVNAGAISCIEGGTLSGGAEKVVLAKTSGLVEEINVVLGEYIKQGTVLAVLSSDSAENSLRDSELSLREAQLSYASTEKQLDNYKITSPISGSVVSKTVKAGDTLESNAKTVMAVIADMSVMSFTIDVDELDIAKVEKGQKAQVTVDALTGSTFTGTVDNVGILGSSSNGVTTYPVRIVFDESEGLWPGMNANANIVLDSVSDVLIIPVAAVSRGNMVLVKGPADGTDVGTNGNNSGAPGTGVPPTDVSNEAGNRTGTDSVSGQSPGTGSVSGQSPGTGNYGGGQVSEFGDPAGQGISPDGQTTANGQTASVNGQTSADENQGWVNSGGEPPADLGDRRQGGFDRNTSGAGFGPGGMGALSEEERAAMRERYFAETGVSPEAMGFPQGSREGRRGPGRNASGAGMDFPADAGTDMIGNVPPAGTPGDSAGQGYFSGGVPGQDTSVTDGQSSSNVQNPGSAGSSPGVGASPSVGSSSGAGAIPNTAGQGGAGTQGASGTQGVGGSQGASGTFNSGAASSANRSGAGAQAPDNNSHYVVVELGLNDDSFIEVKSGLKEGDVVLIAVVSQNALPQNAMMMPMAVGVPGGGGPGGGMRPAGTGGTGGTYQRTTGTTGSTGGARGG